MAKRSKQGGDDEAARIAGLSFEDAVAELESIVEQIESGAVGLEASIEAYERGVRLRDRCNVILSQAEQRIEELGREASDRADGSSGAGQGTD